MQLKGLETNMRSRLSASTLHLTVSLLAAVLVAVFVFWFWYPWPYRVLSGGQELFRLLVVVDVILGPLLTFVIFNTAKGSRHLRRDIIIIASVQLTALAYGIHTVYEARPVALVFEVDRFRVITAASVDQQELSMARPEYRRLPLAGPWLLGTRTPHSGPENTDALIKGLQGNDIGQRPSFWQSYELSKADALRRARPLEVLLEHYPNRQADILDATQSAGVSREYAKFLPVVGRLDWVAILSPNGEVATFLPLDGFF